MRRSLYLQSRAQTEKIFSQGFVGAGNISEPVQQQRDIDLVFAPGRQFLSQLSG